MGKLARVHGGRAGRILAWAATASLVFQLIAVPPQPAAANQLGFFQVIRGVNLAQAGYGGMRGNGTGTIAISGVTGGITAAYLYWAGPTSSADPNVNATVTFAGNPVTGQNIGFSADNCWQFLNSQAYRADVTSLVKAATFTNGGASFALSGFRKVTTTLSSLTVNADVNGASLLVFYADPAKAAHDYLLWNGNDSNVSSSYDPAGWDMTFTGIRFTGGSAKLTLHVSDGQTFTDDAVLLNGSQLLAAGPNFQGDSTPMANNGPANNGSLWDIHTYDVSSFVAGATSLHLTSGYVSDCLSLVAAALELPAGATAPDGKITLAPASQSGPQGSALNFTATPVDGSSAAKSVTFTVSGANTVAATAVTTDATGHAAFAYTPANTGTDTVSASFVDAYGVTRSATSTANVVSTAVSGVAQCGRRSADSTLSVILNSAAGGLVEVLSGVAVVKSQSITTTDGSYSVTGLAANTTFTMRYSGTVNSVRWLCSVAFTTNAYGGGIVPAPAPIADRGNHRFKTAYPMGVGGETLLDLAYLPHQSNYYKVQVHAGQAISVHLMGLTRNLEVVVYKDPFKILGQMGTATLEQVRNATMGAAPDEFGLGAPDEFGLGAPDAFGLGAPDEFGLGAPDELGLGAPDELGLGAPDELGLGAPDEFGLGAPDAFGLGAPDPTEYSIAVRRALIALSRNRGTSDESLTKQTWNDDEFYYVRVVGATGSDYDSTTPYTLSVSVVDSACAATTPSPLRPYQPGALLPGAVLTTSLVLTNTARLRHAGGTPLFQTEAANLKTRLAQFGTVLDLADDVDTTPVGATVGTGIMGAFAQWDANKTCYLAANIVTDAIHTLVNAYRAPGFQFLTIAAPDTGVPHRRYPDRSPVAPEDHYRPPVKDASASNASLRGRQVLTDDFYGALNPAATNIDIDVVLPDAGVGIGRVVESYEDVNALLDSYATRPTVKPTRALVTAYDFLADLGNAEQADLLSAGLTVDAKIEAEGLGALDPTAWSADDLRALLPTRHDILALNAHFSAPALRAANGTHLSAIELGLLADLKGVLMVSNGCHAGYNTIDADAIGGADISSDFASTLNGHGGYLVAGTGYQYGGVKTTNYNEIIQRDLVHAFRFGTGPVSVGKALTQVKRNYRDAFTNLNVMDYKALNETILYGFPQFGVDIQQNRIPFTSATPFTTASLGGGLSYRDFTPNYTLHRNDVTDLTAGETRTFFDIGGDTQAVPAFPIEPRLVQSVIATDGGQPTLSRGAVLFGAAYTDIALYTALAEVPSTEVKNKFPAFTSSGVYPVMPFRLNSGENLVFTPAQFVPTSATDRVGTGRKITSVTARVFYSNVVGAAALAAPPSVYDVVVTKIGTKAHVTFKSSAGFTPGIADAFVTYTATTGTSGLLNGKWSSTELTLPATSTTFTDPVTHASVAVLNTYAADIETLNTGAAPEDVRVLVQAVGGNGAVGLATNRSTYFKILPAETATATVPKQPSALALTPPVAITYGGTAAVTATLTSSGQPLGGKTVRFTIGARRVSATTGANGAATAKLIIDTVGTLDVTASFAEDLAYTGSSDRTTLAVGRATPVFMPLASSGQYSDSILVATLMQHGVPIASEAVRIDANSTSRVFLTDPWGQVSFDTLDFGGLAPNHYTVGLTFPVLDPAAPNVEDDRYTTISSALGVDVTQETATITLSSPGPQPTGPVTLSATVAQSADGSLGDLRTANVTFVFTPEVGTPVQVIAPVAVDGTVSVTPNLLPGLYTVTATVGGRFVSAPASVFLPVFDTTTFITGGGWILTTATTTPVGATLLTAGKQGHFGFNLKYKADGLPTGSLLFNLTDASINLKSTGLDWLVITTGRAEYQGSATINGSGAFKFQVIAIQGSPDRFEIRIWDPATPSGGSFATPMYIASNALGNGSIVIH